MRCSPRPLPESALRVAGLDLMAGKPLERAGDFTECRSGTREIGMAGDWIKFELATLDKPEVCQIADLADIDPDAAVGKLLRVWGWFDQQTENGNAPSVSKRLLDRLAGVTGFCEHMKAVGWMFEEAGVISLPRFERHNGKTAKNRLLTAKRVANHKAANARGNDPTVSGALPREDAEKNKSVEQEPIPALGGAVASAKFEPLALCPVNVSPQAWADWCQHRAEIKRPLTAKTCEHQARQLAGHPFADRVITQSIANGWTGLFPEKVTHASSQQSQRPGPVSAVDRVKQAIAEREARPGVTGQALAEDGGAVRYALDGEFRRVG